MYWLIIIAWVYVVSMMAISEALSSQGSVLGAVITFFLYGLLPLFILLYLLGIPVRRARQRTPSAPSESTPDGSSEAPGDAITAEREKP
jgi:uncharacterized membrane protein YhaH (DUF805 family)